MLELHDIIFAKGSDTDKNLEREFDTDFVYLALTEKYFCSFIEKEVNIES